VLQILVHPPGMACIYGDIFNPKPTKLLIEEWKRRRQKEIDLLLFLQESGNFLSMLKFMTYP
jgi:hypothetical protein